MLGQSGMGPRLMNALVAGYTAALMKAFDGLGGYSDIQLFPGQLSV